MVAIALIVALGVASASAARTPAVTTATTAVTSGSYTGKLDDAPVAVAVIAQAPAVKGQSRVISMYVCNGTSIAVWLTGEATGDSATLRSAAGGFGAQVSVTSRRAGGVLAIPGGGKHRFVIPNVVRVAGLFDVTIAKSGAIEGSSSSGATLSGRVGAGGALPAKGPVAATASADGTDVKLTALAQHLTAGEYRWIVLADGKVYGANKRGPGLGGIGGFDPSRVTGRRVVRIHAGGAGVKGWDTARCQALANKWDKLVESAGDDIANGDDASADAKLDKAQGMLNTLNSKCMVTGIA
ncbi:MAG: hypothetical protein U0R50_14255 [Gaiellales bacterium]